MPLNKAKGRMFKSVGWTWTVVRGCSHACPYCWAASMARRRGEDFTKPILVEKDLNIKFPRDGSWIFVCSTGDLFSPAVPDEWIDKVLKKIEDDGEGNRFLIVTKRPSRLFTGPAHDGLYTSYYGRLAKMRDRVVLGTTIETNRPIDSSADSTYNRGLAMTMLHMNGFTTFLSMEPLAAFDHDELVNYASGIHPEAIEVGLENYSSCLPKPSIPEVQRLYDSLTDRGFHVVLKDNLVGKIMEASA